MPLQAVGILATPLLRLKSMLAASENFQEWLGLSVNPDDRIHVLQTARQPEMPFCLVDFGDRFDRQRVLVTNKRPFEQTAEMVVYIRAGVPDGLDDTDATVDFCNKLGAVWDDIEMLSGQVGYLLVTSISLAVAPNRVEPERRTHVGDYFEAALAITWKATH